MYLTGYAPPSRCDRCIMVVPLPTKQKMRVQFPSFAPSAHGEIGRRASLRCADSTRPESDPRGNALKIKDLPAFAASMLQDAGATDVESAALLRHSDSRITKAHYIRAFKETLFDPARPSTAVCGEPLTFQQRIDTMWEMWVTSFPNVAPN